jgi:hypothetical protein
MIDFEKQIVHLVVGSGNSVMAHAGLLVEHTHPATFTAIVLATDDPSRLWRTPVCTRSEHRYVRERRFFQRTRSWDA